MTWRFGEQPKSSWSVLENFLTCLVPSIPQPLGLQPALLASGTLFYSTAPLWSEQALALPCWLAWSWRQELGPCPHPECLRAEWWVEGEGLRQTAPFSVDLGDWEGQEVGQEEWSQLYFP